uniref:Uncharacterized protein n=1 Tax=Timema douglasi TaxID=61478 RepID=A0A7R8Z5L2_TIMDO|nr:unnamed protein product [Timema douglasi]
MVAAAQPAQLVGRLTPSKDLTQAVDHCKDMVLESPECSEERKWLVRRLIELRFRLQDMKEAAKEEKRTPTSSHSELRVLLGHHFILQTDREPTSKRHCDRCCGIIWSVVHSWYQCTGSRHLHKLTCKDLKVEGEGDVQDGSIFGTSSVIK